MDKTELLALADRIEARVAEGNKKHGFVRAAVNYDEAPAVIDALRRLADAAAEPGEPKHMTVARIDAAYEEWRRTLTVIDKPTNHDAFGQGYVAGWNAKEECPQPAPAFGEVGIKPLEWRGPISAYPTTIWEAKTPFGHYVIEEVSASDSPAYEVRFAGSCVKVKDGVEEAKEAAQSDYETRVRSSTIPVNDSVDRVLSELRDRRLLNDADGEPSGGWALRDDCKLALPQPASAFCEGVEIKPLIWGDEARRRRNLTAAIGSHITGLHDLTAEQMKKIGLWPLKEETLFAARALLGAYRMWRR